MAMATGRVGRMIGKRAAKATARHTAHGVVATVTRRPARSASLLSLGAVAGVALGWLLARRVG